MPATIFVGYDNRVSYRLNYTPVGQGQKRPLNLSEATEVLLQFFEDGNLQKTYSSLSHPGITIENSSGGVVSYQPQSSDFSDVARPDRINRMRWVIRTSRYPDGLVFDSPVMSVRIVK